VDTRVYKWIQMATQELTNEDLESLMGEVAPPEPPRYTHLLPADIRRMLVRLICSSDPILFIHLYSIDELRDIHDEIDKAVYPPDDSYDGCYCYGEYYTAVKYAVEHNLGDDARQLFSDLDHGTQVEIYCMIISKKIVSDLIPIRIHSVYCVTDHGSPHIYDVDPRQGITSYYINMFINRHDLDVDNVSGKWTRVKTYNSSRRVCTCKQMGYRHCKSMHQLRSMTRDHVHWEHGEDCEFEYCHVCYQPLYAAYCYDVEKGWLSSRTFFTEILVDGRRYLLSDDELCELPKLRDVVEEMKPKWDSYLLEY
jgi:hypothetical protein